MTKFVSYIEAKVLVRAEDVDKFALSNKLSKELIEKFDSEIRPDRMDFQSFKELNEYFNGIQDKLLELQYGSNIGIFDKRFYHKLLKYKNLDFAHNLLNSAFEVYHKIPNDFSIRFNLEKRQPVTGPDRFVISFFLKHYNLLRAIFSANIYFLHQLRLKYIEQGQRFTKEWPTSTPVPLNRLQKDIHDLFYAYGNLLLLRRDFVNFNKRVKQENE